MEVPDMPIEPDLSLLNETTDLRPIVEAMVGVVERGARAALDDFDCSSSEALWAIDQLEFTAKVREALQ
jgi:hypothetical protein